MRELFQLELSLFVRNWKKLTIHNEFADFINTEKYQAETDAA
jgi:hypothetical protein